MAPTICSEKKRQARADMRFNHRRTQSTVELSNIARQDVDMQTTDAVTSNELGHRHKIVGSEVNSNYGQLFVDMSDNAVTSTTHPNGGHSEVDSSDVECRMVRRDNSSTDSSYYTNFSSNPSTEASSQLGTKRKRPHYYSSDMEDDAIDEHSNSFEATMDATQPEGDITNTTREMDCDTASVVNSDVERSNSSRLKRGNQPLLQDKLLAKHHDGIKSMAANRRNTDGLLSIALKTIKLVKRNQLLQQRLTQLQIETSEFIQSVLSNPENSHFRAKVKQNVREVENV